MVNSRDYFQRLAPRHRLTAEAVRITAPILILALGITGFLILSNVRGAPVRVPEPVTVPLVETVPVRLHRQGVDIEVDGLVVPHRELTISAQVAGRIKYKADCCRAGNYVTQGTLLIEIDPVDYELEVRRLRMELKQARVMLDELDVEAANTQRLIELAQQDLELQHREMTRLAGLSGDQLVTETRLDQAARAELAARNSLLSRRSRLRLLTTRRHRLVQGQQLVSTQLTKAHLDQQRTRIVAPADGVVVRDLVERDSYVQTGTVLFAFDDTSSAEVKCNLRMKELFWVWQQPPAKQPAAGAPRLGPGYCLPPTPASVIYRLNGRKYAWNGVLSRYDGIGLDEKTRTVPCRVVVDHPHDVQLLPRPSTPGNEWARPALVRGMYVTVIIHSRPNVTLLEIPEPAVLPGNVVWLVEQGVMRRQEIEVSGFVRGGVLVDSQCVGFAAGTRIVVSPLSDAYDGMPVRERQAS